MVIYEVNAEGIGENGSNMAFFEKKGEAARALRDYRKEHGISRGATTHNGAPLQGPIQLRVSGRADLLALLRRAMGGRAPELEDDAGGLL